MEERKKILFICVGNSCRSQMAEGFANYYGEGKVIATSAGTRPAASVNLSAVEVMKERGIDISGHKPKLLVVGLLTEADIVISMGCGVKESCPVPLLNTIDWGLEDPYGQSTEKYREIRDLIEEKVKELIRKQD
ncbi:MAG: arsenate reductase ArsC [Thermoplasmata archaeon]|nr:arsenate reductase ArsC [Thermoplasmata archaeon]